MLKSLNQKRFSSEPTEYKMFVTSFTAAMSCCCVAAADSKIKTTMMLVTYFLLFEQCVASLSFYVHKVHVPLSALTVLLLGYREIITSSGVCWPHAVSSRNKSHCYRLTVCLTVILVWWNWNFCVDTDDLTLFWVYILIWKLNNHSFC